MDGKLNICKNVKSMIDYSNIETVYKILQLLDIPHIFLLEIFKRKTPKTLECIHKNC